jgi:uncharacterized protein YndB with AHSA1/START domain
MTHDLSSVRTLPVPPAEVWKAWEESAYVKKWWGPEGFTCPIAEVDFREGGRTLVCMTAPGMGELYNTWTYTRIAPHERIEYVLRFSDSAGEPQDPPMPGVPSEVPHVVTFEAVDSGTRLTVAEFGYATAEAAAISRSGLEQCLDKLVAIYG